MSIVLELQQQALNSNTDILSLLRKASLVAHKLELKEFENWINNELNGYKDAKEIPEYRKIHGELKGFNPYKGWISVIDYTGELEKNIMNRDVYDSIPSLCALLHSGEKQFKIQMPGPMNASISKSTGRDTKYALFASFNSIDNILEQTKNKILEWTLILEEKGIIGDGLTFTEEEKTKAQSESQIVNYTNNFFGDVYDAQIQQGTVNSKQKKQI